MIGRSTYVFTIPGIQDAQNARKCWQSRLRETKKFRAASAAQARAILTQRGGVPIERARITFTLSKPGGRPIDPLNAPGHCKAALDGLVVGGLIPDDDAAHVEILPIQQERGPRATKVTIEDITPTAD